MTAEEIKAKTINLVSETVTELARKFSGNSAQELHFWTAQALANDIVQFYRDYMTAEYDAADQHEELRKACFDAVYATSEEAAKALETVKRIALNTVSNVVSYPAVEDNFIIIAFFRVTSWNDWSGYVDFRPETSAQLANYAIMKFFLNNIDETSWAVISRINAIETE